ncbi:hypothetical protein DFH08DRAFT_825427 [Mycena albidolilacea]|uniref:Uncharacterized protein n=1 Tax=Mycena albidolilacea TaxID=1033008 RepID=A0AAD6Z375_9AGAR|nr:hypothetical protein DFH08DRAFT_825427 [Mycena albidolilacea]
MANTAITGGAPSSLNTTLSTTINGLDSTAAFKHNSVKNTQKFMKKIRQRLTFPFKRVTVGGLFIFMDYRFKMEAGLATEDPEEYKQVMVQRGLRLKEGLGLFSTKELVAPAE